MKKLLLFLVILTAYGCQAVSQTSPQPSSASTECSDTPKAALSKNNVENISLSEQKVNRSGQASASRFVGYTFEAKAGQKLSYRTNDDICIWVYTPDSNLITSGDLPQSGKYTLQISAPKGSTTFNVEMSLGTLQASLPSVPSSPPVDTSTSDPTSVTTEVADFSQEQALELVTNWYKAKSQIFGPPFDKSLLERYTTGKLYRDKVKPGGSIDWLRNNDCYYEYTDFRITKVVSFSNSGSRPSLVINIYEELYLHHPKGIDKNNSGPYNAEVIYFFDKTDGDWKISDYQKLT